MYLSIIYLLNNIFIIIFLNKDGASYCGKGLMCSAGSSNCA